MPVWLYGLWQSTVGSLLAASLAGARDLDARIEERAGRNSSHF